MMIKALLALAVFASARPGYRYEFPRDHFGHPEFKTEWWYWTGNLRDAGGRRFGFELTFFRQAVSEDRARRGVWDPADLYLAHLALSDIERGRFYHYERLNREGPGVAGAIWNGNWRAGLDSLEATTTDFTLRLKLSSSKPPVIHGVDGVSRKSPNGASHYISFTRLAASGTLELDGRAFQLSGSAWMDHEFFTHQLEADQAGWDWLSIQLDNGAELMLFRLRRKDGSADPYSAGTYIDPQGRSRHLALAAFRLTPAGEMWNRYPVAWRIEVPSLGILLNATTPMKNQELRSSSKLSPTYWEGAMDFSGTAGGKPVRGVGYLEMTGYAGPPPKL
jgi:predicted secreted hydrolase